jgi:hypothetical protein
MHARVYAGSPLEGQWHNIGVAEFQTWRRQQHLAHIQNPTDICPKQQKQLKEYPKVGNGVKGYRVRSSYW